MGETARFRNALAGTFGFNDFISQGDSEATIQQLLRTIVPTVDMRDFQRRYEFDTGVQALFLGERVSLLRWTVPANEYWRPLNLFVMQTDSGNHQVFTTFTMARNPTVIRYVPTRTKIQGGQGKIVYGADQDGSISGQVDEWTSRISVIMEPGDIFSFVDETDALGALTLTWVFVYERVPQPAVARNPGVEGVVTVV